jgi:hypothetical protein
MRETRPTTGSAGSTNEGDVRERQRPERHDPATLARFAPFSTAWRFTPTFRRVPAGFPLIEEMTRAGPVVTPFSAPSPMKGRGRKCAIFERCVLGHVRRFRLVISSQDAIVRLAAGATESATGRDERQV